MGRRKKETTFSYTEIVVSSYVRNDEYLRAQARYSEHLGKPGSSKQAQEPEEPITDDVEDDAEDS